MILVIFLFRNDNNLNNLKINKVDQLGHLGFNLNSDLDFNRVSLYNFKKDQNRFFFFIFFLGKLVHLFIYKTFCLSQFTYGHGIVTLNKTTFFLNSLFSIKENGFE